MNIVYNHPMGCTKFKDLNIGDVFVWPEVEGIFVKFRGLSIGRVNAINLEDMGEHLIPNESIVQIKKHKLIIEGW